MSGGRMRIVHVTDFYLPRLGGIEMQVSDLARRQAEAGHDVQVLTCSPPDPGAVAGGGPVRVTRLPTGAFGLPGPAALRRAGRLVGGDVDVVHVHVGVGSPLAFWTARAAARCGVPTVVTIHSVWWRVAPVFRALHVLGGWRHLPVQWTAVSEVAAAPARRILGAGTDVAILGNGVDASAWCVPHRAAARPGGPVVVAAVMRLAARKRPLPMLDLLQQARALLPADLPVEVVVVGDGPQRAAVQRRLTRRGMADWVHLTGRLDRAAIRDVYRRADVFLAPARLESFGIAALEAHCAGLPVVALRAGGIGEFVEHGRNGLLGDDDAELAALLARLCRDPALRRRLTGTPPAAHLDWACTLPYTEELYRRAGARAGRAAPAALADAA